MGEMISKENELALQEMEDCSWGNEDLTSQDVVVNKVKWLQGMSEPVVQRLGSIGDLFNVGESRVYPEGKFVGWPISVRKYYWVMRAQEVQRNGRVDRKFEYEATIPYTGVDMTLKNDENVEYIYKQDIYFLPAQEDGTVDISPIYMTFASSSLKAARQITYHFLKMSAAKLPNCHHPIEITTKIEVKDGNSYSVPIVRVLSDQVVTKEISLNAYKWFKMLREGQQKAIDSYNGAAGEEAPVQVAAGTPPTPAPTAKEVKNYAPVTPPKIEG